MNNNNRQRRSFSSRGGRNEQQQQPRRRFIKSHDNEDRTADDNDDRTQQRYNSNNNSNNNNRRGVVASYDEMSKDELDALVNEYRRRDAGDDEVDSDDDETIGVVKQGEDGDDERMNGSDDEDEDDEVMDDEDDDDDSDDDDVPEVDEFEMLDDEQEVAKTSNRLALTKTEKNKKKRDRKKRGKKNAAADSDDDDSNDEEQGWMGGAAGGDSDAEDSDDDDDEILKESKRLDREKAKVEEEAAEEMEEMLTHQEKITLMSDYEEDRRMQREKLEQQLGAEVTDEELDRTLDKMGTAESLLVEEDIRKIHARIVENVRVLVSFTKHREEGYSRQDYVNLLRTDLCKYYGYGQELMDVFINLFSAAELVEFLEANEQPRPLTIRSNSLKTRRRILAADLISRGVNLDPLGPWTKVGLKIYNSSVPVGATPEYLAGHYMIQSASSYLPVMALGAQPGETVLDMAAAPGGKTTYIAAMMKNTGTIYANDINETRSKALVANVYRMGVRNAVMVNFDGRDLPTALPKLDRVLLDAPCTGLGVIARDPSIKLKRTKEDIAKCSQLQKQLLLAAIDCVNSKSGSGGIIVYSTCSVSIEENEEVVDYALRKRNVKIVDSGLPFGVDGFTKMGTKRFHTNMKLCKRVYPHTHNMDGFFVCKLMKVDEGAKVDTSDKESLKREQKKQERESAKRKEEKEVRKAEQQQREDKNKKLFEDAMKSTGGHVQEAMDLMKQRKQRIMEERGVKKSGKTTQKKWRPTVTKKNQSKQRDTV